MTQLKNFFDIVNELSMKSDKKLPNLKVPAKGKKGVSKFMRKQTAMKAKDDVNASTHSADKKPEKYIGPDGKTKVRMVPMDKEVIKKEGMSFDQMMRMRHQSSASQKKNQKKRDDKEKKSMGSKADMDMRARGTLPTKEASVLKPTKPTDITKHARTLAKNDDDYNRNKKKYIDKARSKVFRMYPKEEVDEALTLQQRMKRSRLMKRLKTKIKIGRQRAMRKMANKKTLEKRAMRQARNDIAKKLTRGIPKRELTFARKQEIEKRLEKPALQQRIKRIAKRLFKDVRKKEVQRKKG
tara:strand:+ start:979 stop:1866 length:888 start_codon:yes stop_codon:yes gene_type:complete